MNFIIINKQTARRWMMTPYIFVKVEECDDTDSNKTEVEEIEMVDMEGRAEVKPFSKIQTDNLFFQKFMISQYPRYKDQSCGSFLSAVAH